MGVRVYPILWLIVDYCCCLGWFVIDDRLPIGMLGFLNPSLVLIRDIAA